MAYTFHHILASQASPDILDLATDSQMTHYLPEFLTLAIAHLVALAIPGPDFAIILKQSLTRGRRAAVFTSLGIGSAITIHIAYTLFGSDLIHRQSAETFTILKYCGALYLMYLGLKSISAKPHSEFPSSEQTPAKHSFIQGFLTNGLNPKVPIFCFSLFSIVIHESTPTSVRLSYGIFITISTIAWFISLSYILSHAKVRNLFQLRAHWLERFMGIILIALGVRLALSDLF